MEHRWTRRLSVRLDVVLSMHGRPIANGHSVDVSDLGMFLELTDGSPRVIPGQAVEVALRSASDAPAWAVVVHRWRLGIGIMFARRDPFDLIHVQAGPPTLSVTRSHVR